MPRALITGITGQDGAYLAQHLLDLGYEVVGMVRRSSVAGNLERLDWLGITDQVRLVEGDLQDLSSLINVVRSAKPDEVYNLAAQSFVGASFSEPLHTADVTGIGVARMLEALRTAAPEARFYQASTSELFGKVREVPQSEATPFHPRSPYGVAKLYGHWITINYRESYGMHACAGILFNHESPLRGLEFVTRKITHAVARIRQGLQEVVALGNLGAQRDWGYAGDYVRLMHLMLQQDEPQEYVFATGQTHTIRDFAERAFAVAGMAIQWEGEGVKEVGRDRSSGKVVVRVNPDYFRPAEVELLIGDPTRAITELGWRPQVSYEGLIEMMVKADLDRVRSK
ncbi:MAG: GDP-mannose 4,6-dehydratase [Alphaproteobacteria bacterium CG_4_10_14_0_2_um_filter_63_37]|nr:MAG: GDP-mannose 4,6-dehydratase [Proteobacteria bacterium CG1_02_64_396]PJA23435.1 MAG: GDP-mannose 4,6-dehydratase [Alphaproteobacteria bacterium CG_4_10_14_0_2_um_filter_63_37]